MTTETYRDTFGIPHLRATTATALAHAQGLITARDRGSLRTCPGPGGVPPPVARLGRGP
nr:penicillin acylase family protein [Streptomyces niveiscabiei]